MYLEAIGIHLHHPKKLSELANLLFCPVPFYARFLLVMRTLWTVRKELSEQVGTCRGFYDNTYDNDRSSFLFSRIFW